MDGKPAPRKRRRKAQQEKSRPTKAQGADRGSKPEDPSADHSRLSQWIERTLQLPVAFLVAALAGGLTLGLLVVVGLAAFLASTRDPEPDAVAPTTTSPPTVAPDDKAHVVANKAAAPEPRGSLPATEESMPDVMVKQELVGDPLARKKQKLTNLPVESLVPLARAVPTKLSLKRIEAVRLAREYAIKTQRMKDDRKWELDTKTLVFKSSSTIAAVDYAPKSGRLLIAQSARVASSKDPVGVAAYDINSLVAETEVSADRLLPVMGFPTTVTVATDKTGREVIGYAGQFDASLRLADVKTLEPFGSGQTPRGPGRVIGAVADSGGFVVGSSPVRTETITSSNSSRVLMQPDSLRRYDFETGELNPVVDSSGRPIVTWAGARRDGDLWYVAEAAGSSRTTARFTLYEVAAERSQWTKVASATHNQPENKRPPTDSNQFYWPLTLPQGYLMTGNSPPFYSGYPEATQLNQHRQLARFKNVQLAIGLKNLRRESEPIVLADARNGAVLAHLVTPMSELSAGISTGKKPRGTPPLLVQHPWGPSPLRPGVLARGFVDEARQLAIVVLRHSVLIRPIGDVAVPQVVPKPKLLTEIPKTIGLGANLSFKLETEPPDAKLTLRQTSGPKFPTKTARTGVANPVRIRLDRNKLFEVQSDMQVAGGVTFELTIESDTARTTAKHTIRSSSREVALPFIATGIEMAPDGVHALVWGQNQPPSRPSGNIEHTLAWVNLQELRVESTAKLDRPIRLASVGQKMTAVIWGSAGGRICTIEPRPTSTMLSVFPTGEVGAAAGSRKLLLNGLVSKPEFVGSNLLTAAVQRQMSEHNIPFSHIEPYSNNYEQKLWRVDGDRLTDERSVYKTAHRTDRGWVFDGRLWGGGRARTASEQDSVLERRSDPVLLIGAGATTLTTRFTPRRSIRTPTTLVDIMPSVRSLFASERMEPSKQFGNVDPLELDGFDLHNYRKLMNVESLDGRLRRGVLSSDTKSGLIDANNRLVQVHLISRWIGVGKRMHGYSFSEQSSRKSVLFAEVEPEDLGPPRLGAFGTDVVVTTGRRLSIVPPRSSGATRWYKPNSRMIQGSPLLLAIDGKPPIVMSLSNRNQIRYSTNTPNTEYQLSVRANADHRVANFLNLSSKDGTFELDFKGRVKDLANCLVSQFLLDASSSVQNEASDYFEKSLPKARETFEHFAGRPTNAVPYVIELVVVARAEHKQDVFLHSVLVELPVKVVTQAFAQRAKAWDQEFKLKE